MEQFVECLEGLEDPDTGNVGRHDFYELLIMVLCAVLCGGRSAVSSIPSRSSGHGSCKMTSLPRGNLQSCPLR